MRLLARMTRTEGLVLYAMRAGASLGKMISDPLSRTARRRPTTADGSHMSNKLSFLVFDPSPML
jgi:hypothetical protein